MKGIAIFSFILLTTICYSQEIVVQIYEPYKGKVTGNSLFANVQITSTFDITQVVAKVQNIESPLTFTSTTFQGSISLAGLPQGKYTLAVTATDVKNNTASSTVEFIYELPPTLVTEEPLNNSMTTSNVSIKAKCSDLTFSACKIKVGIAFKEDQIPSNYVLEQTNEINTELDLSAYNGSDIYLHVVALDSLEQQWRDIRRIFIESSPYLKKVASVTSYIADFDGDKIIYVKEDQGKKIAEIMDVSTSETESIPFDNNIKTFNNLVLTHNGALFEVSFPADDPNFNELYFWDRNGTHQLATHVPPSLLNVKGDYVVFHDFDYTTMTANTHRVKLSDLSKTEINNSSGYVDVAENGLVVYNNNDSEVFTDYNGIITKVSQNHPDHPKDYAPLTDGTLFVYRTMTPDYFVALALNNGTNEILLSDFIYDNNEFPNYLLTKGYVAYGKKGNLSQNHIWMREPSGENHQVTFFGSDSKAETLTENGDVSFMNDKYRFIANSSGDYKKISTQQGKAYFKNNKWYITLGGTLLEVDTLAENYSITDLTKSTYIDSVLTFSKSDFINALTGSGELIELSILELPKNGHLVLNDDMQEPFTIPKNNIDYLEYHPNSGYAGMDTIIWKAFNGLDLTDHEARVIIKVDLITGVPQNSTERIAPYPNPVTNALTISLRGMQADQLGIAILNLQGQVIFEKNMKASDVGTAETYQIDTETLKPGIYLMKLNYRQHVEVRKFVKQ